MTRLENTTTKYAIQYKNLSLPNMVSLFWSGLTTDHNLMGMFKPFAKEFGFTGITSRPRYPQSNGFVENGVRIIKRLLKRQRSCI